MGTCMYCGQSAGFFFRVHKECKEKHERGLRGLGDLMHMYFSGNVLGRPKVFFTDKECHADWIKKIRITNVLDYGFQKRIN